jgi:DNA-binding MarR family transcriptional regulator
MKKERQASRRPRPASRSALVADLNRAAREASGLGNLYAHAVAVRLGVSATDLECLDFIASGSDVTAGDLARATGLTTGAITGVIDRLEKAGLAARKRDPEDRRKVYVRMTAAGRGSAARYYGSFGRAIDRLARSYSEAEIALFIDYFTRSRAVVLREIERLETR